MGKVTLTKEQVSAIEEIKDKDYAINILALNKRPDHPLASLEMSLIAKLLYGLVEYEVEPEKLKFKIGDKVLYKYSTNSTPEIYTLVEKNKLLNGDTSKYRWFVEEINGTVHEKEFRHATQEEIFWYETLGREFVGDFTEGDIVVTDLNVPITYGEYDVPGRLIGPERLQKFYKNNSLKGIYPAESFKPFSQ